MKMPPQQKLGKEQLGHVDLCPPYILYILTDIHCWMNGRFIKQRKAQNAGKMEGSYTSHTQTQYPHCDVKKKG